MDYKDIELIRALQKEDIFLTLNPFQLIAEMLGWGVDEVIGRTKALNEAGIIRRFGAALTPRNAGFSANAMVAWEVGKDEENAVAEAMASHPRISHCYIRPTFDGFPYNVYTMIHGNSDADLKKIIRELSELTRVGSYRALTSIREFKKSSPLYFP